MKKLILFLVLLFNSGCQSSSKVEAPKIEVDDILASYLKMPKPLQKAALENEWVFFTKTINFIEFQKRLLSEAPSLNGLGSYSVLTGAHPLDIRPQKSLTLNAGVLLLSMDLEMEMLAHFHGITSATRCLENLWSEFGFPINRTNLSQTPSYRTISQINKLEGVPELPLTENSKRLALYLQQSLALAANTPIKLIKNPDSNNAQFAVSNSTGIENFDIFKSEVDCKVLQEKKFLLAPLGRLRCLQKQSGAWITIPSRDADEMSSNWENESRERCLKWNRALSDEIRKSGKLQELQQSALKKSWSFYPRLRKWIESEAARYQAAFRKALLL